MVANARIFHEREGLWYHGGAVLYALTAYALGIAGLLSDLWWVNLGAIVLWGHGMVIAAYMIHECGHNTVFRSNRANARLGRFLNWVTGTCYGTFEDIRHKHFRHHMDNDDAVWWLYEPFFRRHPLIYRVTRWLEWLYVPAHELIMHSITVFTSFVIPRRRDQRLRNVVIILVRGTVFCCILWFQPKVALGYLAAYLVMIHVLRLMDSTHHDYGPNPTLFVNNPPSRFGGREREQEHTFSCPVSLRFEKLNWLVLNFGFHNAHHARPTVPWYRLPAFDRERFGDDPARFIPFTAQLRMYHRFRVCRILHEGGPLDDLQGATGSDYLRACRQARNYGGNGVSFLTSF
ncbi:fatty acid desaturase family protein [Elongatibacter sediminis]|uniref:Fatty acid desaturase n=1 Tax=Elongatibacter sediminis TaxID=3119006 RepID=A0AAW9RI75_9GAMM